MKLKSKAVLIVVVLIAGCGKKGPELKWPAQVGALEGFPTSTQAMIRKSIDSLNASVGKPLISIDEGSSGAIRIVQVADLQPLGNGAIDSHACWDGLFQNTRNAAGNSAQTRIAGRATLVDDTCKVEIASFVENEDDGDLLEAVLWHELGHCAGLKHDEQAGEIMYRTTTSFRKYQQTAVQRFLSVLIGAVGLEK